MHKNIILIADDEPEMLSLLESHFTEDFKHFFIQAVRAESGAQCLRQIEEINPSLFIIDFYMPPPFGLDLIHEIRRIKGDVPIIVMSAMIYQHKADLDKIPNLKLLPKPFSPDQLTFALTSFLG